MTKRSCFTFGVYVCLTVFFILNAGFLLVWTIFIHHGTTIITKANGLNTSKGCVSLLNCYLYLLNPFMHSGHYSGQLFKSCDDDGF